MHSQPDVAVVVLLERNRYVLLHPLVHKVADRLASRYSLHHLRQVALSTSLTNYSYLLEVVLVHVDLLTVLQFDHELDFFVFLLGVLLQL